MLLPNQTASWLCLSSFFGYLFQSTDTEHDHALHGSPVASHHALETNSLSHRGTELAAKNAKKPYAVTLGRFIMYRYSPPKSNIWGHSLRNMEPVRQRTLFAEFLKRAVAEHTFTNG